MVLSLALILTPLKFYAILHTYTDVGITDTLPIYFVFALCLIGLIATFAQGVAVKQVTYYMYFLLVVVSFEVIYEAHINLYSNINIISVMITIVALSMAIRNKKVLYFFNAVINAIVLTSCLILINQEGFQFLISYVGAFVASVFSVIGVGHTINTEKKLSELNKDLEYNKKIITERNKELSINEQRLERAQSIAKTGSWEFNLITNNLVWSKEHYKIFEIEEELPAAKLYDAYRSKIHPDDIPELDRAVSAATEKGEDLEYHHRVITKNGDIKYVVGKGGVSLDENNKPTELFGTNQDITLQVQQEKRINRRNRSYEYIVENVQEIIYRSDLNGFFTFVNKQTVITTGYSREELIGMHYSQVVHKDCIEQTANYFRKQFAPEAQSTLHDVKLVTKSGEIIWIEQTVQKLLKDNKIVGFQSVVRNVTDRKLLEQQTKEALKKEKELTALKTKFISNVSHEFRTPLTIIQSNVELISHYLETSDKKNKGLTAKTRVISEISNMQNILEDLLSQGKEAQNIKGNLVSLDLASLVNELIIAAQNSEKDSRPVKINIKGNPKEITTNDFMMRRIILNLLTNALKYSSNSKKAPIVDVVFSPEQVELIVADFGVGIPKDDLDNLFQPFFRAKNTDIHDIKGSGLGLAMVKENVNRLGGIITVESEENKGSTFKVELPLVL